MSWLKSEARGGAVKKAQQHCLLKAGCDDTSSRQKSILTPHKEGFSTSFYHFSLQERMTVAEVERQTLTYSHSRNGNGMCVLQMSVREPCAGAVQLDSTHQLKTMCKTIMVDSGMVFVRPLLFIRPVARGLDKSIHKKML